MYLAAQAHGAKQLAAVCVYWMAVDFEAAKEHEQWEDISPEVKAKVIQEAERLTEEKKRKRVEKEMLEKLPCMLSPGLPYRPEKQYFG